ncbi:hypothetical protein BJ085DRAFT_13831, partial [Dimargaris cristalligena]
QFGDYSNATNSPTCGKCIRVYGPGGTVQAKLVDQCTYCSYGSIALSSSAYSVIADTSDRIIPVRWEGC